MKFVTAASHRSLSLTLLRLRAATGFECVVLRPGCPWTSNRMKLACLLDFSRREIDAGRGHEPFVFADAFDVIMLNSDPSQYRCLYRGKPLFAAEMFNWPDKTLRYPEENRRHAQPYLNSGCFIAAPADIHLLLSENDFSSFSSDQLYWAGVYVNNPGRMELDFESRLCACLGAWLKHDDALQIRGRDLLFLERFANPLILHFNGPAQIKQRMWRWYVRLATHVVRRRMLPRSGRTAAPPREECR